MSILGYCQDANCDYPEDETHLTLAYIAGYNRGKGQEQWICDECLEMWRDVQSDLDINASDFEIDVGYIFNISGSRVA
tara:strand:+ start:188 stop:421 length:234 start_codon:yes stop_codon:yes gene_type:complete